MEENQKSRVDTSVPRPDAAAQLSEEEKRAMELNDQIEHTHGQQREDATRQAADLGGA